MDEKVSPTSRRTQARIIDAAVESVAAHGISGTTLATVAKGAGVSQGVLVFHFKTKDGLLTETLRRLSEEYRAAWEPALAEKDPLDRILGLVKADFGAAVCSRRKLALWFAFWGEAGAQPLFSAICEAAKDAGIIVFTIGFEAPRSGQAILRECASSDSHFYDVEGLEIADAFASIASAIRS